MEHKLPSPFPPPHPFNNNFQKTVRATPFWGENKDLYVLACFSQTAFTVYMYFTNLKKLEGLIQNALGDLKGDVKDDSVNVLVDFCSECLIGNWKSSISLGH